MTIDDPFSIEGSVKKIRCLAWPRSVRTVKWAILVAASTVGFLGCGDRDELPEMTKQAVKIADVPENLRTAASKAIPGVTSTRPGGTSIGKESFIPTKSGERTPTTAKPARFAFRSRAKFWKRSDTARPIAPSDERARMH